MKRNLNAILLLDDRSRVKIKTSVSDLSVQGLSIIGELTELNETILDSTRKVLVLEDALRSRSMFSDLKLFQAAWNLEYHFVGVDDALLSVMAELGTCYKLDPTVIDYNDVYGIVYGDSAFRKKTIEGHIESEFDSIAFELLTDKNSSVKERRLAEAFLSLNNILKDKQQTLDKVELERKKDASELGRLTNYSKTLEQGYFKVLESANQMNQSLKQYEVILSKDIYTKIRLDRYQTKPSILYLKTYEDLLYLNSLLESLFEMFRLQARMNVKVVRLYDSSSSRKILSLPGQYYKVPHEFLKRDIIQHDFIAKVGGYEEMFDILLNNPSGLDLLIVVDQKDHSDVIFSGSFLQLALCRNEKRMHLYGLSPEHTIVNNSKSSELSWDFYEEFSSLNSEDKYLFLSSRPLMQRVFELQKLYVR